MTEEQIKLANSYIKLDEVTELIGDLLCIPDFESRNITEKDVSKVYDKILGLDRKALADNKGEWIATENEEMEIDGYFCSKCDLPMPTDEKTPFCPFCGADMRGNANE